MTNTIKETTNALTYDPEKTIEIYKNNLEREKRSMKQIVNSSINCGILVTPKQTEINHKIAESVTKKISDDKTFESLSKEGSLQSIDKLEETLSAVTSKAIEKALEPTTEDTQIMTLYVDTTNLDVKFSRKPGNVIASFSGKKFLTSFIFNFISAFEVLISSNKITKKELVLAVVSITTELIKLFMENLDKKMDRMEKDILKVFLQKENPFDYISQNEILRNVNKDNNYNDADIIQALNGLTHYKVLEKDEASESYQLIESLNVTTK